MTSSRHIFIGAAWPYSNNSLHLGHVAALLPADIIARYHRQKGDHVLYVSGSDCHGTPITIRAEQEGIEPRLLAERYHQEFMATLIDGLGFSYDLYTKTMGQFHIKTVQGIFLRLFEQGWLIEKTQNLPFCSHCQRFLPDRYVEGECPECHHSGARGDQCENCGKLLDPKQLVNPICKHCRQIPEWRDSQHLFLNLPKLESRLRQWLPESQKHWRANASKITDGWLAQGLEPRPITRDTLWGVPVPDTLTAFADKSIYVWFEAVCGYFSASKEWAEIQGNPDEWREFWQNPAAVHYYVHGKDNVPFHTIIWPAILSGLDWNLQLPSVIVSSEYLQFGSKKVSKSSGNFYTLPRALEYFDPDAIRYYLTAEGPETRDSNFDFQSFSNRVNGELIGNVGNLCNRVISLVHQINGGYVTGDQWLGDLHTQTEMAYQVVGEAIEATNLRVALSFIRDLSQEANRFLAEAEPWKKTIGDPDRSSSVNCVLQIVANVSQLMAPFLPFGASRLRQQLNVKQPPTWQCITLPVNHQINQPQPLYQKVTEQLINQESSFFGGTK
jgi:methionyl-tRNA synthetase